MSIHEKALEAATEKLSSGAAINLSRGLCNTIVKTYLTTLLDSPEMVEVLAKAIFTESGNYGDKAQAVIAAIKKESGI